MRNKNLLVITNNFPDEDNLYSHNIFVKEQLKYMAAYFANIYVVSPLAYGMSYLRGRQYSNYTYDNIHVYFPKYFNLPFFYNALQSVWVKNESKCIFEFIKKYNLKFDYIHAHFTWPSGAAATKLKSKFNVPVIITEHTSNTFSKAIESSNPHFLNAWNSCDAIIRVKNGDINKFKDVEVDVSKVHHIPNGYDDKSFYPIDTMYCRSKLDIPHNKKVILNVGNLYSEIKGHRYLIEAMAHMVEKRKDVVCYIVGGGKLEKKLKNLIHSYNLQDCVKLVGSKPYDEIPIWMNACDVFVLPSLKESFGIVQIEAMACSKPVVATINGGSEEIITSDDFGLLVEPSDSHDLAEKIDIALNKNWDTEKIISYAEQYQWDEITKQIHEIYAYVDFNEIL